jgi:polyisoprenoid-binding protein YceI
MFKVKFLLGCIVLLNLCFTACKSDTKEAPSKLNIPASSARQAEPQLTLEGAIPYKVTEGVINWQGSKTLPQVLHFGTIKVLGGEIMVKEGRIVEGNIKVDMNSLSVTDPKDPKENADLLKHLKSADFFDVAKFPTAEFRIDDALPSSIPDIDRIVVGKLTIKGISNSVNIPTKLTIDKNSLVANSLGFQIQRQDWGITFGSGPLGVIKENAIDNIIKFTLSITAKP